MRRSPGGSPKLTCDYLTPLSFQHSNDVNVNVNTCFIQITQGDKYLEILLDFVNVTNLLSHKISSPLSLNFHPNHMG